MSTNFGFPSCKRGEGHPYLFISYKSEESSTAAKFARHLYENDIHIYYDNALTDAVEWEKELLRAIEDKDCFGVIMMVSARSLKSPHVQNEAQAANHSGKVILGVFTENVVVTEQPMKTYLGNIQAIPVWALSEKEALQRVLIAAFRIMNRTYTPSYRKASIEEIYTQAFPIIHRFSISNNNVDFENAVNILKTITEYYPTDYRGWLYLANLCCAKKPGSPTEALRFLTRADEYYKGVELTGYEKNKILTDYEEKSQLLSRTIEICRTEAASISRPEDIANLISTMQQIKEHLDHTAGYNHDEFDRLLKNLKSELTEMKNKEKKQSEEAKEREERERREKKEREEREKREKEKKKIKTRLVLVGIFGGLSFLGLMVLLIYTMWCIRIKNMDISTAIPLQTISRFFIQENYLNHLLISICLCTPFFLVTFIIMPHKAKVLPVVGLLSATISQALCLLIYQWISPPFCTYVEQALCFLCNIGVLILGISGFIANYVKDIVFCVDDYWLYCALFFLVVLFVSLFSLLLPSLLLFIPRIIGFVLVCISAFVAFYAFIIFSVWIGGEIDNLSY